MLRGLTPQSSFMIEDGSGTQHFTIDEKKPDVTITMTFLKV